TQHRGERWSAARAYIEPNRHRPNLHVITGAQVERVLFEGRRAVGVQTRLGGPRVQIQARREVVLSAGALQTPQLLMLSGVGPGAQLQDLGIPVLQHLPGVGENLQDHPDFVHGYLSESLDAVGISLKGGLRLARNIARYQRERRGMISSNFAECGGFLKTRPELALPNVQLHFVVALVNDHARELGLGHGLSCHVCLLRPRSRGSLRLAGPRIEDRPLIDPAFLADPADVDELVEGFKLSRELMRQPSLQAFWTRELWQAQATSDDDIRELLRRRVDTVYHPVGSCRMGRDPMAVVDAELRVHGLQGLRVVDASVMPTLIGGNTNAPCMVIGEKAALMMRASC
ncbi:MAG TPA: GMC oxidoreductase, partial [Burkholderiaceae bacterium]|nr:GMC oxidoreductase [Burkholderiaceae bacterium]